MCRRSLDGRSPSFWMTLLRRSSSMIDCNGEPVDDAGSSRAFGRVVRWMGSTSSELLDTFRFDFRQADLSLEREWASSMASMLAAMSVFSSVVDGFQSGYTRLYVDSAPLAAPVVEVVAAGFSSGSGSSLLRSFSGRDNRFQITTVDSYWSHLDLPESFSNDRRLFAKRLDRRR